MSLRVRWRAWIQAVLASDQFGLVFSAIVVAACILAAVFVTLDLALTSELCQSGYIKFC